MILWFSILVVWCSLIKGEAAKDSPRIIIIGAGASGISAAARLLQNGFNNVTLLEAENRIGGRIHTIEFGEHLIDVGGQWVHGEEGNIVHELAWPMGLIEHSLPPGLEQFFSSSDAPFPEEALNNLMKVFYELGDTRIPEQYANKSVGDYVTNRLNEYFQAHPNITASQQTSMINMLNLIAMSHNAADSWYDLSGRPDYIPCKGDQSMNWKDKGYSTILDILMKKIPNPAEELPVKNQTILNTEVSQINYNNSDGRVRVVTANGDEYTADHVIVTVSIGVLKADHETMFNPKLSETKITTMKGLQLGNVVKIFLWYDEPWWNDENGKFNSSFVLYWTEEDRKAIENDPNKSWMLGVAEITTVEHKPGLLLCWITGPRAREMETVSPSQTIFRGMTELFQRFFGKTYNMTEPVGMMWSQWNSNKHFRGTWSSRNPEFARSDMKITDLSDPIMENGKPVVMFAGEATDPTHFSTVHGAIGSGWREADRLKSFYDDTKSTTPINES